MWRKVKSFLFTNITTRQTVAKNTFWLALSNFGGRLIRAVIIIYGARILGAAGWGVFSYGVTLAAFLTPFTDVGLSQVLIRETSKNPDPEHRARILSTTFVIKLALLVVGIGIVVFLAPLFTTIEAAKPLLPIIAFLLAFDSLREFGSAVIRAMEKMEWEAGLFLLTNVAIVVFGFVFLAVVPTPASFTYAYAFGTAAGAAATFFALRKHFPRRFISRFTPALVKPIFTAAWPLSIAALLGLLMLHTDVLIIGWLRSAEEVGFYAAAYRIVQLLYLIPAIFAISAFPTFSRLAGHDQPLMRTALERTLTMVLLMALPLVVGGTLLASQLITFLFSAEFLPGTGAFSILLVTLLIDFPVVILSNALFAYNRPRVLIAYAAIGGSANIVLDLIFIPAFGITGVAWATLFAQILSNIYLWSVMKKLNRFSIIPHLKIGLGAALCMGVVTYGLSALHVHVIGTIAISAAVYGLALYFFKEPMLKEMRGALQHTG
ncbi:MAG: flippase [Candidatus Liptonbacteria bacterium]|nr:flippase [Candidatus Liptonbacteria bacterium]